MRGTSDWLFIECEDDSRDRVVKNDLEMKASLWKDTSGNPMEYSVPKTGVFNVSCVDN